MGTTPRRGGGSGFARLDSLLSPPSPGNQTGGGGGLSRLDDLLRPAPAPARPAATATASRSPARPPAALALPGLDVPATPPPAAPATGAGRDAGRQLARNLATAGTAAVEGVAALSGGLWHRLGLDALAAPSDWVRREAEEAARAGALYYGEPETAAGVVAGVGGRLLGDAVLALGIGKATEAAAASAEASAVARRFPAVRAPLRSLANPQTVEERLARNAVSSLPMDAIQNAAGRENSAVAGLADALGGTPLLTFGPAGGALDVGAIAENPVGRLLADWALSTVAGTGLEEAGRGLGRGVRGLRSRAAAAVDLGPEVAAGMREGTAFEPGELASPGRHELDTPAMPPRPLRPVAPQEAGTAYDVAFRRSEAARAADERAAALQAERRTIDQGRREAALRGELPRPLVLPGEGDPQVDALAARLGFRPAASPAAGSAPLVPASALDRLEIRRGAAPVVPRTSDGRAVTIPRGTPPTPEAAALAATHAAGVQTGAPRDAIREMLGEGPVLNRPALPAAARGGALLDVRPPPAPGLLPAPAPVVPRSPIEIPATISGRRAALDDGEAELAALYGPSSRTLDPEFAAALQPPAPAPEVAPGTALVPVRGGPKTRPAYDWEDAPPSRPGVIYTDTRSAARDLADGELLARYRQTLRTGTAAGARATEAQGRGSRRFQTVFGSGVVGTGGGRNARGSETQAIQRLEALSNEIRSRGLALPDPDDAFLDVRADELPFALKQEPERVRALDDGSVEDELREVEFDLGRRPGDPDLAVQRGLLAAEARRRGLDLDVPDYARAGYAVGETLQAVAGAGGGAAVGAGQDREHPLRGAALGAAAGAGAALGAGALFRTLLHGRGAALAAEGAERAAGEAAGAVVEDGGRIGRATAPASARLNVAKLASDPDAVRAIEAAAKEHAAAGASVRGRTSEDVREAARRLALKPDELGKLASGRQSGAEILAMADVVNNDVAALQRVSASLADPALAEAERAAHEAAAGLLERRISSTVGKLMDARSQKGRDLAALKLVANQTSDPAFWLERARRAVARDLTEAERSAVMAALQKGDPAAVAQVVAGLTSSPAWQKFLAVRKGLGLLSAPLTSIANVAGNTAFAALERVKDVPAALFDRVLSLATGMRTTGVPVRDLPRASLRGAVAGVKDAANTFAVPEVARLLRQGDARGAYRAWESAVRLPEVSGKMRLEDIGARGVNFDNAFADVWLNKLWFKNLSAQDAFFKGLAFSHSISEQATLVARAEGLRGRAAAARVAELVAAPSDEMALRAVEAAEIATFTNRGTLARAAGSVKQGFADTHPLLGAGADLFLPFTGTPANVATRFLEYTPAGALRWGSDTAKLLRQVASGNGVEWKLQRRAAQEFGRMTTGAAPVAAGLWLAQRGLATGGMPDSPTERSAWELEGRKPYSVLVGGEWRALDRFGPAGNLVGFGADLAAIRGNPDATAGERAAAVALAVPRQMANQTFLQGTRDVVAALDESAGGVQKAGRLAGNLLASFVPAVVGAAARAGDDLERQAPGVTGPAQAKLPGAREALAPRVDALGQLVRNDGGVVEVLDPMRPSPDRRRDDPLRSELSRLGVDLGKLQRGKGEAPDAWAVRQQLYGRALDRVLREVVGLSSPTTDGVADLADAWATVDEQAAAALRDNPDAVAPELRGLDPAQLADEGRRRLVDKARSFVRSEFGKYERALRSEAAQMAPAELRSRLEVAERASAGAPDNLEVQLRVWVLREALEHAGQR